MTNFSSPIFKKSKQTAIALLGFPQTNLSPRSRFVSTSPQH
ncbi:MAG: hypothetical protein SW833_01560 [Cyanobacteriota bacterium]|nr:hypothetical protein [Cyanobacteriota bacterium]